MRNLTAILCLTIAVFLGSAGVSWSADFQKGVAAYKSGDYATALRELTPFAENKGFRSYLYSKEEVMYEERRGRKKKNTTDLHHSTVTECSSSVVLLNSPPSIEVYLTFDVDVIASHLSAPTYNDYQQFLYDTITELREKGWYFGTIADWLNENGYPTVRGKTFRSPHVHSIIKKKRIRNARLDQRYQPELSTFGLRFVDRTRINAQS